VAALARRRLDGQVAPPAAAGTLANVRADQSYWLLLDVAAPVLSRAEDLVQAGRLRTLDAIHVASCLVYQGVAGRPVPFVTADARQRRAAERANLEVVWVE
jgi:predicted nucleic acid-binding protein